MNVDLTTQEKAWTFFSNHENVEAFIKNHTGGEFAYKSYQKLGWAPVLEPKPVAQVIEPAVIAQPEPTQTDDTDITVDVSTWQDPHPGRSKYWRWEEFDEEKSKHRLLQSIAVKFEGVLYVPVALASEGDPVIEEHFKRHKHFQTGVTERGLGPDRAYWPDNVIKIVPYPKFPQWVMQGTSIYEGLVKPVCDVNSRYPEFMWMPAMALLLNYLGTKVEVEMRNDRSGIYMIVIGQKGRVIKSSSVEDAMAYFQYMGCLEHGGGETKTAEGRSLVWTVGSTEGFGIEMQRTNCKNGVLFFDEFKLLADKAGIESSSMKSHLLTIYEQGKFANTTKDKAKKFSLAPNSYVGTVIACTTPKNFHDLWSTFAYGAEGMDDRFFFLLQPQTLKELTPQVVVNTKEASARTRALIEQAVMKKKFQMIPTAAQLFAEAISTLGNRPSQRAEKWARAIAVDLGKDESMSIVLSVALPSANTNSRPRSTSMSEARTASWRRHS